MNDPSVYFGPLNFGRRWFTMSERSESNGGDAVLEALRPHDGGATGTRTPDPLLAKQVL